MLRQVAVFLLKVRDFRGNYPWREYLSDHSHNYLHLRNLLEADKLKSSEWSVKGIAHPYLEITKTLQKNYGWEPETHHKLSFAQLNVSSLPNMIHAQYTVVFINKPLSSTREPKMLSYRKSTISPSTLPPKYMGYSNCSCANIMGCLLAIKQF